MTIDQDFLRLLDKELDGCRSPRDDKVFLDYWMLEIRFEMFRTFLEKARKYPNELVYFIKFMLNTIRDTLFDIENSKDKITTGSDISRDLRDFTNCLLQYENIEFQETEYMLQKLFTLIKNSEE